MREIVRQASQFIEFLIHRSFQIKRAEIPVLADPLDISLLLSDRVLESAFYQSAKPLDRQVLIGPVSDKRNGGVLYDSEREHTQKTFGVDAAVAFFDHDAALVTVCLLDKESRGSGVQADAVSDGDLTGNHNEERS